MKFDVTVVIPAYNAERFLRRALESVVRQSHPPSEVIVVDDGSVDATPTIAREFGGVRLMRQQNSERGAARNAGIRAANARYVALLDADDEWTTDHLERAVEAFDGSGADATFGAFEVVDELARLVRRRTPAPHAYFAAGRESVFRRMDSGGMNSSNVVATRQIFVEAPFSEMREMSGSEDWHCWARISGRFAVRPHRHCTCRIFIHGANSTLQPDRMLESMRTAVLDLAGMSRFTPFRQEASRRLDLMTAGQLRFAGQHFRALRKLVELAGRHPVSLLEPQWWHTAIRAMLPHRGRHG